MCKEFVPGYKRWPELHKIARRLANELCAKINAEALKVESEMPYKAKYILEVIIEDLKERV